MIDVGTRVVRKLRRSRMVLAGAAALLGGGAALLAFLPAGPASAISPGQFACSTPSLSIKPSSGYTAAGPAVHVNDGTKTLTDVELTVSADANVSNEAEMRMSWSIDGSTPTDYQFGPGNIAENQQFDGTRTVVDVAGLGSGTHTIQPEVRISGGPTASGEVLRLCTLAQRSSN